MNKYRITTDHEPIRLQVKVSSSSPQKLGIRVYDINDKTRVFTDRYKTIDGQVEFSVRMPVSPKVAAVEVYPIGGSSAAFSLDSVEKLPLQRKMDKNDIGSPDIRSFVDFAERIAYNLGSMDPEQYYSSDDGKFHILVSTEIKDSSGNIVNTPARISRETGVIQISKKAMLAMTIPMRIAILLHEFSHYYMNEKIDDEMEADLNGLLIYLALGFPRIEAFQAFTETFKGMPSQLNGDRTKIIEKFIMDFENMNIVIDK